MDPAQATRLANFLIAMYKEDPKGSLWALKQGGKEVLEHQGVNVHEKQFFYYFLMSAIEGFMKLVSCNIET